MEDDLTPGLQRAIELDREHRLTPELDAALEPPIEAHIIEVRDFVSSDTPIVAKVMTRDEIQQKYGREIP